MPDMLIENLALLFERDLRKLKTEINQYPSEDKLWEVLPGTTNTGGNLCLHLLGNLQYFIGAVLGNSGYLRNRPAEFSNTVIPVAELNVALDRVIELVPATLRSLNEEKMADSYPEKVFDYDMTIGYFLIHLLAHLDYHLGQVNYHRRITAAG